MCLATGRTLLLCLRGCSLLRILVLHGLQVFAKIMRAVLLQCMDMICKEDNHTLLATSRSMSAHLLVNDVQPEDCESNIVRQFRCARTSKKIKDLLCLWVTQLSRAHRSGRGECVHPLPTRKQRILHNIKATFFGTIRSGHSEEAHF